MPYGFFVTCGNLHSKNEAEDRSFCASGLELDLRRKRMRSRRETELSDGWTRESYLGFGVEVIESKL